MTKCPSGHDSTDNDFCSTCGTEMSPQAAASTPGASKGASASSAANSKSAGKSAGITAGGGGGGSGESCPTCTTERDDPSARFCGVCGHDYETGRAGSVPTELGQDVVLPQPGASAGNNGGGNNVSGGSGSSATAAASLNGPRIDLTGSIDATKPGAPTGEPERKYILVEDENLIGRGASSQGIGVVGDSAVSKKHALIVRQDDGSYIVRDVGSTNGTSLDGKELRPNVDYPLAVGSVLRVGEWTVLTVTAIKSA